jgi:hypothetical protein
LLAHPENVGASNAGADVDIRISLLDAMADTIDQYNPVELLSAGVDTLLKKGIYYLVVEGVGNAYLSNYGSLGHYFLSGALNMALPSQHVKLKGKVFSNYHLLNWSFLLDEEIKEFQVQRSNDGVSFVKFINAGTSQAAASYQSPSSTKLFYRVKAITLAYEISYYSNIISLPQVPGNRAVRLLNTLAKGDIKLESDEDCKYQLMMCNGQVIEAGKINKGWNRIVIPANVKGLFLLRFICANEVWTEKIVKQ